MSTALRRVTLLAACLSVALPASAAQAGQKKCGSHTTQIAKDGISVFWHDNGKLWSCTQYGGRAPQNRALGPWTAKSRFELGGGMVVGWTQRVKQGGKAVDLLWAADISRYAARPLILRGLRPAVGPGAAADRRVAGITTKGRAIAWVTTQGRVLTALSGTVPSVEAQGTGTPGAADLTSGGVAAGGTGLLAAPLKTGKRILIGQWKGVTPTSLADSLSIAIADGESDDCGGGNDYTVLVTPKADAAPVGATASLQWSVDSPTCS